MGIEIRHPVQDELSEALVTVYTAFGDLMREEDFERERKVMPLDRVLAVYDDGRPVGVGASYPFELTIPGGQVRAGGVTWVGVVPSHRRRGILRQLMRRQLDDHRGAGEPLAILYASESAIYGRFGYGIAAPNVTLDAQSDRFRFRGSPDPVGSVRLVDREEALELFPPVYDRVRVETPGMFARTSDWWAQYKVADPEHWRRGAGPKFFAVLEVDGAPEGFAIYRVKSEWEQGIPRGEVRIVDVIATSPIAARELWRFLFGLDLVAKVQQWMFDPASPLFLMVEDARRLHLRLSDGLWLRLVDVEAALGARSYATEDSIVIELQDEFCPWNAGRWRVGTETSRTTDEPDLALDAADLSSVYLGAFDFHRLAAAQRVQELRPAALERASALFRTARPPYCPEEF